MNRFLDALILCASLFCTSAAVIRRVRQSAFAGAFVLLGLLFAPPSFASTFSWTPGNTDILVNSDALVLTVDGVTVTVQAFTAEINIAGDDADVLGPWPTQVGSFNPGFGIDVRGLGSEQLGLFAAPLQDIPANGSDFFSGGGAPGFASGYATPSDAPSAFHFAVFSFDQPVDVPGVTVDDVTNQERDIWMATGTTLPDFNGGFLSGLAGFDIVNSPDDLGDGLYTHNLAAVGISHLFVGAPPEFGLGLLTAGDSHFFIDSFDASPSPVPIPATVYLFGSALGLLGWMRRKKT